MARRRPSRDPFIDDFLGSLLNASIPAYQKLLKDLGEDVSNRYKQAKATYENVPGPPSSDKVLPPPEQALVCQRVIEDGVTRTRWLVLKPGAPTGSIDEAIDNYLRDPNVRMQMIFRGSLYFFDDKDKREAEGSSG